MGKIILKILILVVSVSGFTYFFNKDIYTYITQEDSIFENLTALAMLLMSILLMHRAVTSKGREKRWLVYNILLALACFFGFGEEISWGQRIFSIESSEFFSNYNLQNETNIHNLSINGVKLNKLIFSAGISIVAGIYFFLFLFIYKKNEFFRRLIDSFGVHIPKLEQIIILIISTVLVTVIPDGKKWELWETAFVLIFFLVLLDPFNEKERLFSSGEKEEN